MNLSEIREESGGFLNVEHSPSCRVALRPVGEVDSGSVQWKRMLGSDSSGEGHEKLWRMPV